MSLCLSCCLNSNQVIQTSDLPKIVMCYVSKVYVFFSCSACMFVVASKEWWWRWWFQFHSLCKWDRGRRGWDNWGRSEVGWNTVVKCLSNLTLKNAEPIKSGRSCSWPLEEKENWVSEWQWLMCKRKCCRGRTAQDQAVQMSVETAGGMRKSRGRDKDSKWVQGRKSSIGS